MSKLFCDFYLNRCFWLRSSFLLLVLISLPCLAMAKTIIVGPSGKVTTTSDQASAPTIQQAIEAAHAGDTIKIMPGTYKEAVSFKKNLTISGSGADVTHLEYHQERLVVSTSDVKQGTIQGLTIKYTGKGQRSAIWFFRSNILLENCVVSGGFYAGIYITANSNVTIRNCQVVKNRRIGINIANSTANIVGCAITQNEHYGLKLSKCRNTIIAKNQISQNRWSGIYISDGVSMKDIAKSIVTIRHNTIQDNKLNGIHVELAKSVKIHQNTVQKHLGSGVKLEAVAGNLFLNVVTDNRQNGIVIRHSSQVLVDHNTIASQKIGLLLENSDNLTIQNNIIAFNSTGVVTKAIAGSTFSYNNLWTNKQHYVNLKVPASDTRLDPQFVSVAQMNYALRPNSPMIGLAADKTDLGGLSHSTPPTVAVQSTPVKPESQPEKSVTQQVKLETEITKVDEPAVITELEISDSAERDLIHTLAKPPDPTIIAAPLQERPYLVEVGQTVQLIVKDTFPDFEGAKVECQFEGITNGYPEGAVYQNQVLEWKPSAGQIGTQTIRLRAGKKKSEIKFFVWQQNRPPRITKINEEPIVRTDRNAPVKYEILPNKETKLIFEAEGEEPLQFSYVFLPVGAKTKDNTLTWKPPRNLGAKQDDKWTSTDTLSKTPGQAEFPVLVVVGNGHEVDALDLILVVRY